MKERMSGRCAIDRSIRNYVVARLGRAPNCSVLSAMHRFERDMDRWLKRLDDENQNWVC